MKLRLKPTIIPYRLPDQVVLRFNGQYAKIPDTEGAIWTMTAALDGTKNSEQVIENMLRAHPNIAPESARASLQEFIQHRLVEIPEEELSTTLSESQRSRFSRNIDFFGSMAAFGENKFRYQEKLRARKVCVLGCGGLGTHILYDLAAIGIKRLTILDFDKIEVSNLNRQILYKEADIGTEKVLTAKKRLLEFNGELDITTHSKRLESTADVAAVIEGQDLVICVADKPANYIGEWLNEACVKHRVPFITGGLDVRRSVFYSVSPGVTGCEECWLTSARSKSGLVERISTISKTQNVTYEHPAPAFVTLVAVTAGMIVSEAVKYLTECQPPELTNKSKEFSFDNLTVEISETWSLNRDCKVCGHLWTGTSPNSEAPSSSFSEAV